MFPFLNKNPFLTIFVGSITKALLPKTLGAYYIRLFWVIGIGDESLDYGFMPESIFPMFGDTAVVFLYVGSVASFIFNSIMGNFLI